MSSPDGKPLSETFENHRGDGVRLTCTDPQVCPSSGHGGTRIGSGVDYRRQPRRVFVYLLTSTSIIFDCLGPIHVQKVSLRDVSTSKLLAKALVTNTSEEETILFILDLIFKHYHKV